MYTLYYCHPLNTIGEYSAKNSFPQLAKKIVKTEVENFLKLHFIGKKNCQDLSFFGEILQKLTNLGVKIEKIG